jgi:hypothetical protein
MGDLVDGRAPKDLIEVATARQKALKSKAIEGAI